MLEILHRTDLAPGPLLSTFLLGFTTLILLLWYSNRKHRYWIDRGIPQMKVLPLIGLGSDFLKKPLHEIELEYYRKLGKVFGHYEGSKPLLAIADPEILKRILVKDFHVFPSRREFSFGDEVLEKMMSAVRGEDWKRIRTIVTPTFTTGKIKRMLGIFKECSQSLVQTFKEAAVKQKPIEVKSIYGTFTMDIIASSAFSTKIDSHNDPNNQFVQNARLFFPTTLNWRFILLLTFPSLLKLFRLKVVPEKAMKFFTDVTSQIIEERKKTGQTRNDFLQLLLDTSKELSSNEQNLNENDDIAENYGKEDNQIFKQTIYSKKSLSYPELLAQCFIFFIAGFETTATTLAFASYYLALNPDIQEKLIQEIDDSIAKNNGQLTYEAIQSMKYLDNVIAETLRLNPPLARCKKIRVTTTDGGMQMNKSKRSEAFLASDEERLERQAQEDYFIKEIGMTIPKGMIVTIPVYAIHIDPKFYPDPEKFNPDRFTPEERAKRDQYVYLPFGLGPRNCVGMRFALMEIKVCLANVLRNLRIKRCPETKVPLEFHLGNGFFQPKDITLSFEVRTDSVNVT